MTRGKGVFCFMLAEQEVEAAQGRRLSAGPRRGEVLRIGRHVLGGDKVSAAVVSMSGWHWLGRGLGWEYLGLRQSG